MRTRSNNPFSTVTTSGLLLPIDLLARVAQGDPDLKGLKGKDYHLRSGERLNEAAARAWSQCLSAWKSFRKRFKALPASDIGTTTTRDEWLLPLFQELGYGRLQTKKALDFDGTEYPISHGWEDHIPIHLLSASLPLDRRTAGVSGAAARAPYSLMQELLNRSATHRWGFVTNGLKLYLLRDNAALARAANVEFDFEAMMDGEVYADFFLLFCLCHQSRVEIRGSGEEGDKPNPEDCWLEDWATQADQQGTRAREKLRDGVETSIKSLGAGFLTTRGNEALRARLSSGELSTQDFYRQLLRLVYRLLMLLVAEEKRSESGDNLLHPPGTPLEVRDRYARFYSVGRVRSLAYERRGTAHTDLYETLKVLFLKLRTGYEPLGIPGMGSFLFSDDSTPDLDDALMANQDLLDAFRNLCYTDDTSARGGGIRRPVDFGNLGSEELGSVYESLLELHPLIDTDEGPFTLGTAAGHERKTTGSYYTPTSLINCLLDSALDPVVHEAINVPDAAEAERKLLGLKVCDPACGSGHFLIAAADRMAMHLARIRTGDDQPNTIDIQHAKRDIIGRCIYGVDMNPMAVELCKVSLWMEALEPGKPLSFLDHHIQCGNSLIGATPKLLAEGIPDAAFKAIEGDDKEVCKELKKRNKQEREDYKNKQGYLFEPIVMLGNLTKEFAKLTAAEDDSLDSIAAKREKYAELVKGTNYQNARLWADTWCAAFVWKKDESDLGRLCPTERKFRDIERNPHNVLPRVRREVERLSDQNQFFHWHLAFPDVLKIASADRSPVIETTGSSGGFDAILGNPPWERLVVETEEFFSERAPEIAKANKASVRSKMIAELKSRDPSLLDEWKQYNRLINGMTSFLRHSGRLPLTAKGNFNTYALLAELASHLVSQSGAAGLIVPTGLATDRETAGFFSDLVNRSRLRSFYDFTNQNGIFSSVHRQYRFALLSISGCESEDPVRLCSMISNVAQLNDKLLGYSLSPKQLARINPNTGALPVFQNARDALLVGLAHRKFPVLKDDSGTTRSDWEADLCRMYHMGDDSSLFARSSDEHRGSCRPLYEAKLIWHFDSRFATFDGVAELDVEKGLPRETGSTERTPEIDTTPRYWVPLESFKSMMDSDRRVPVGQWFVSYRDITNATNERTMISCITPWAGHGDTIQQIYTRGKSSLAIAGFAANLNSFALDFIARRKISGSHIKHHHLKQFPVVGYGEYHRENVVFNPHLASWAGERVVELSYVVDSLREFAIDCGYDGPPFRWDEERRFQIRCELDAAYFHLYLGADNEWAADNPTLREMFPTPRHAVDYIMDTFPIVRRKDEAKYDGEYRTKTTILRIYDEMAEVIKHNDGIRAANPEKSSEELRSQLQSYQSQLTPPPGPPADADGNFIPFAEWTDEIHQRYADVIHPARESGTITVEPKQPAKPTRKLRPGIAAKSTFPEPGKEFLTCGLTLDLILRKPGLDAHDYSEFQGLALRPQNVRKLLHGSAKDQQALDDAVTSFPIELKDVTGTSFPWDAVIRALEAADAIQVVSMGDYETLQPGDFAVAARNHFGCLSDDYMDLVMIAIQKYQSIFQETHEQMLGEELQQVKNETKAWATAINPQ